MRYINSIFDSIELHNKIAEKLIEDSELRNLLGVIEKPNISESDRIENYKKMITKINLQRLEFNLFEPKDLPFISVYVHRTDTTNNYLINRSLFRVEIFHSTRGKAAKVILRIKKLLKSEFDMHLVNEGERPSDIKCVYRYRLEYLPPVIS